MNTNNSQTLTVGQTIAYGEHRCMVTAIKEQIASVTILVKFPPGVRVVTIIKDIIDGFCFSILSQATVGKNSMTTYRHIQTVNTCVNGYILVPTNIEVTEER